MASTETAKEKIESSEIDERLFQSLKIIKLKARSIPMLLETKQCYIDLGAAMATIQDIRNEK